jgi:Cu+-exporting ATPase
MALTDNRLLKDPVCGMTVTTRSPHAMVHEGIAVYFCGAGCKSKFLADPAIPPLETDENPELKDFRQRFFWTLPLTVIVAVLAMASHGLPWLNGATES